MWDKAVLEGYVNATSEYSKVINKDTRNSYIERVERGAITKSIARHGKVRTSFNHDRVIASPSDIEIVETFEGFRFKVKTDDIEVITKAIQGKLLGCSFTFFPLDEVIHSGEVPIKIVTELMLTDISILDITPAYSSGIKIISVPESMKMKIMEYKVKLLGGG